MDIDTSKTFKLLHPFSMTVAGIGQSGKTEFVKRLILNSKEIIIPSPDQIVISYTENQEAYTDICNQQTNVKLIKGLDFELDDFDSQKNSLLILDDQMCSIVQSEKIQELLTRGVHHRSISVIMLTQNLFPQGKHGKTIRLNCHYIVVMKSPTFASQINCLSRQIFPNTPNFFSDAYKKATKEPYSYLLLNLHPRCEDQYRVIQVILGEANKYIFLPK